MDNCKANHILDRSSHRRCSAGKDVSENSQENTYVRVSLYQGLWHKCFPVNFAKFLITPFLQNTSGRLLLFRVNRLCDYYAKHLYKGLSVNNCSVDFSAIKNT